MEKDETKLYEKVNPLLNQIILKLSTMPEAKEIFYAARKAKDYLDEYVEGVCLDCGGTGEVSTDESDGEGHMQAGVGTAKCLSCSPGEPDDMSGASEGDR